MVARRKHRHRQVTKRRIIIRSNPLRDLRQAAGLSQTQLVRRMGTTQANITRLETGKFDPRTQLIADLAKALRVSEEEVFQAVRKLLKKVAR